MTYQARILQLDDDVQEEITLQADGQTVTVEVDRIDVEFLPA